MKKEAEKYQALLHIKNVSSFLDEFIDTVQMYDLLYEEISKIIKIVDTEILRCKDKTEAEFLHELHPWFRIMVRSVIATIEAICYKFKQLTILVCDQRKKTLSKNDREKLKEKKWDREGKLKNYYLESKENIKFTLKKIYYAFDLRFEIKDFEGWEKLSNTIDIRNKLTHPKKKEDLEISAQQYRDASVGFNWFRQKIEELVNQFKTSKS